MYLHEWKRRIADLFKEVETDGDLYEKERVEILQEIEASVLEALRAVVVEEVE